ncbi:MAG: iron-regulated protein [Anaerolineae bacterium]|nr:iron-regulated protein [Anaerolineae bacterium]
MKLFNHVMVTIFLGVTVVLAAACGNTAPTAETTAAEPTETQEADAVEETADLDALKSAAVETYAAIVFATYEDAYNLAVDLQDKIDAFVADPTAETMQAAKEAWLAAREPYGQTEAFRFYGGPIDDEDGPEGLINAWPLDEVYIDYVDGEDNSGIINDTETYPTIDKELLISLNEVGAEENISTGFHAIEFLLWGQDLSSDGAGNRPYTDYVADGTAPNPDRRALYLQTAAELLVEDLAELKEAWDPAVEGNYRADFLSQPPHDALQKIFTGIGVLSKSELAGERIFTAYDNQDQEDEHSCFSDNTHRDIITNAQGIYNVYMGEYTRVDGSTVRGTSLADVIAAVNPDLNGELVALLDTTLQQVNSIHVPFDQAIVLADERPQILEVVTVLQDSGDKIAEVSSDLGLTINTALPE